MWKSGVVATLVAAFAVAPAADATTGQQLQTALEQVVAEHQLVPGASAYVDAPRAGLPWTGAAGQFAEGSTRPLSAEDPFRIASIQKIFTAAAILRLVEDGRLRLDDPIAPFLDADQVDRMHVYEGVNYGRQITIRQLLQHTSGLNSHDECNEYLVSVGTGPRHEWTPREQIEMMIDCGDPYFRPGEEGKYHYSDTGFVMLGNVLSSVTGKSYAEALRELLPLVELGVERTWHELLEPERADPRPRAHQYYAAADLTDWNPSFDSWGGGGYVSTVQELVLFIRGLFEGRVFKKPSTLRLMMQLVPTTPGKPAEEGGYGLGLAFVSYDGVACIGHAGFWSSVVRYCPSLDLAFAATTNQASDEHTETTHAYAARAIVAIVKEAERAKPTLKVKPKRTRARRSRLFTVTFAADGRPVGGATARIGRRRAVTDASGRARIRVRFTRSGVRLARACKSGVGCATAAVRVR
jgi:D-alanyl-D-alanine carboxypeptidase